MRRIEDLRSSRRIAKRVQEIRPSGIRRFFDLIAGRDDIISLGVGEPDFSVPWRIREEIIYALEKGYTAYTSNFGLKELREGIVEYYKKFGVKAYPEQVIITCGVSEALDLAVRTLVDHGDVVLIPEPCYVSYKPLTYICNGEPVELSTLPDFKLTYEKLMSAANFKPKILIINYPNNPTGVTYSRRELEEIADAAVELDMTIISDEIYAELTYSEKHTSIASLNGMEDRVIVLNGFSKSFAMTGLRIGFAIAPLDVLEGMLKIHQYTMLCAPTPSQIGALEALKCLDEVEKMRTEYMRRRNYVLKELKKVTELPKPEGAFYAFPKIPIEMSSEEFAEKLLIEKSVAVVPGNAFGESGEGFVRLSYAVKFEKLREALNRIVDFIDKYAKS
ncbi:MAG: aminotransferase class I/II-fold pyridoxal phosphate-dependent enzyme [Archaeoglobaceae archaeon]|nr:aminotransferase class I/II-fold pyridoxal phosphate-dependent enzyme [Archaeoglobaceae archaeon]MCX8152437.1 aminotransferase class I/II-fold pyridoxal phosphate-dependent enzyme [Archaeoglobaceae archaeon]MDW8013777.1 aminotransferase class I/II-fold pyridoxal phosphate-dependent enzyme [Archaeoglobaceae archaeon]